MPQELVGPPILRQFDRATAQIPVILLEFRLKAAEQGEGIGGRPRESSQNLVLIKPPDFLGRMLDDRFTQSHLSVPSQNHAAIPSDAQHRCRSYQSLAFHKRNS